MPDDRRRKSISRKKWSLFTIGAAVLLLIILAGLRIDFHSIRLSGTSDKTEELSLEALEKSAEEVFVAHRLRWFETDEEGFEGRVWSVQIPDDLPIPALHLELKEGVARVGGRILFAESEPVDGRVTLFIGAPDTCLFKAILWPIRGLRSRQGQIAILIDDFGDRWDAFTESFLNLDIPLSISIIPGLRYSEKVNAEAFKRGREILLHLPMQPVGKTYRSHPLMIKESMTESDIQKTIEKAFNHVPDAVGVNNHMGSLITANRRIMKCILQEIKKRDLYFLDSRTTAETVAYTLSTEMGVPSAERDVFIDAERTEAAIRASIDQLSGLAEKNGFAIGIGHGNQLTLIALRDCIPKLKEQGFEFVRVSEIVR